METTAEMGMQSSKSAENESEIHKDKDTVENCTSNIQITVDKKLSDFPRHTWEKIRIKQIFKDVESISPFTPISQDCIRFVCVSDTHNTVENKPVFIPDGDILLHAGDFTMKGTPEQIDKFNTFLGTLPHKVKVVVPGNHDMTLDDNLTQGPGRFYLMKEFCIKEKHYEEFLKQHNVSRSQELLTNCVFLKDSSVSICGINIYGAPWVPEFCYMGFNVERGHKLMEKWDLIPSDTDILITHGPPLGRGDLCFTEERAGCLELLNTIQKRVKPKYHVFGHIHEGHGMSSDGTTTYINAATCDLRYHPKQSPLIFDLPIPQGHTREELLNKFTPVASSE